MCNSISLYHQHHIKTTLSSTVYHQRRADAIDCTNTHVWLFPHKNTNTITNKHKHNLNMDAAKEAKADAEKKARELLPWYTRMWLVCTCR